MILSEFQTEDFNRGRPVWVEALWLLAQAMLVNSWIPGSRHRVWVLRRFGARIGRGAVLKPYLRVKFPWRMSIGDHVWLGEGVWIDNLGDVDIGDHVCISQGAYLCTGSHDWSSDRFRLIVKPIRIASHAWICAKSVLAPGAQVGEGAVLSIGSIATGRLEPWYIHSGAPARAIRPRQIKATKSPAVETA